MKLGVDIPRKTNMSCVQRVNSAWDMNMSCVPLVWQRVKLGVNISWDMNKSCVWATCEGRCE